MIICLKLMPLRLTVSCFSEIQIGFTFLVPAHLGSPGQGAVKQVCVASAGPYANNLHLTADRLPHQHLITQVFYRQDALPDAQPTV